MSAVDDRAPQTTHRHVPVLCDELVAALEISGDDLVVDCTFGRGGHARSMLAALGAGGRLLGLDQDPTAVAAGDSLALDDSRFVMVHSPFSKVADVLDERGMTGHPQAIAFDLGVSSPQLDEAERGFSFRTDGPLDMRMDTSRGPSAQEWLADVSESDLADTLYQLGDERESRRIARNVVRRREQQAFERTADLADVIAGSVRRRVPGRHPATRSFQAIRMRVNNELEELRAGLQGALDALAPGGRLVVISFHSLEDRIVKHFMRDNHRGPELPRRLPPPPDLPIPPIARVSRAIRASTSETDVNPRARSAVLRVAEVRA